MIAKNTARPHRRTRLGLHLVALAVLLTAYAISGRTQNAPGSHHDLPLGKVEFSISCSDSAQAEFERALALLHHMTYPQARQAFERVLDMDSDCAMAHWGVAMTLFQPLWPTRPRPEDLQRGWDCLQRAKALKPATERERLFIDAAEAFFLDPVSPDYWLRIHRWEEATQRVYANLPQEPEAALFYALAHLATTPADIVTRTHADAAATILLSVYDRNPDHPGAMHYLVHSNDVPGRERELLDITRKYERIAPNNPHALHMPTHIYTRLGDWNSVIRGNLKAADAALAHPVGERGDMVWDEFAHAIEYLVYAYLQQGADEAAAAQLQRLHTTPRLEPTFKTAFHLASTQARYALERRAWDEAARIVPRSPSAVEWDRFTWPEAAAQFARGLGAAHLGQQDQARGALQRLEQLETATQKSGEDLFARNIQVLRLELSSWILHAQGRHASSVPIMREALALEDATPKHAVTPGPTLPASELFGDLLAEQGRTADALNAYQHALARYPNRFNSLLGAARAARSLGDDAASRKLYQNLVRVAGDGQRLEAIREANRYLGSR